jgi:Ca2+/Na+ antiporter
VKCYNCSRTLCPYCDHRIKGDSFCQDCIVAGIESLLSPASKRRDKRHRSWIAALCSLFPGGGAVYNRQNVKALIYFITIVGLFHLTTLNVFEGLLSVVALAFYLYSIVDSYRTAELIAAGDTPGANEERFKRALARRASALGLLLISGGLLVLIQMTQPFGIELSLVRFLPAGLIVLGGYLIVAHLKRRRDEEASYPDPGFSRSFLPVFQSRRRGEPEPTYSAKRSGSGR